MKKIIIMGAAGRDFHDFNTCFRDNPEYKVVAFTATQIPDIEGRQYPSELAGKLYPDGIPVHAETELARLIQENDIDYVYFSYSDVKHEYVMHRASEAMAQGAGFALLGPMAMQLKSTKPVISICAVRTGCGKSQISRAVATILKEAGKKVVVVRHPMPYGNLAEQAVQRFASYEDLEKHRCTIEEREEYELHVAKGIIVYAGVDYERILRQAEQEADVVIWDGGNNDIPFFRSDLRIVVADPFRPGHELKYHPGETNFRMADVIIINKVNTAKPLDIQTVINNAKRHNPQAQIIRAVSEIKVERPELIQGKRVIVVEDGPTLTHGEMRIGAGYVAAKEHKAETVSPRPYAVGSIRATYDRYANVSEVLPAMGYGKRQIDELQKTINAAPADAVVIGTPIDLGKLITINKPFTRVYYSADEQTVLALKGVIAPFL